MVSLYTSRRRLWFLTAAANARASIFYFENVCV
uniref:Uncharacterized protein n=1 Tax=Arundo donax TaxID=35708 RepID=A0A0A9B368_ARUDO